MQVLVVNRRKEGSEDLCAILKDNNITCEFSAGKDGVAVAHRRAHDVVMIDADSEQAARDFTDEVRVDGWDEPLVIVLPELSSDCEIRLLEAGADECLSRPLETDVLVARLRALIRRCEPGHDPAIAFEDLTLNTETRGVMRAGEAIHLTAREFAVLEYFVRNPRRIVTRQELGEHVWEETVEGDSNVIDVFVSRLRRKVDKPFEQPLLHTLIGSGYMLSLSPPRAND